MLIHFESIEEYNVAINKKNPVPMDNPFTGTKLEWVDSGIQDHIIKKHTQYWIPKEQIKFLKEKKEHYFVNDIEVNKENFELVLKEINNDNKTNK